MKKKTFQGRGDDLKEEVSQWLDKNIDDWERGDVIIELIVDER